MSRWIEVGLTVIELAFYGSVVLLSAAAIVMLAAGINAPNW